MIGIIPPDTALGYWGIIRGVPLWFGCWFVSYHGRWTRCSCLWSWRRLAIGSATKFSFNCGCVAPFFDHRLLNSSGVSPLFTFLLWLQSTLLFWHLCNNGFSFVKTLLRSW